MTKKIITVFIGCILLTLTFLTANVKESGGDYFFKINDNIQNEELRIELKGLTKEFNIERSRIQDYYKEKIEVLKKNQKDVIQNLKSDFSGRKEELIKKYGDDAKKTSNTN